MAVGVIVNEDDEVLISRRHPDSHQGGLWEFPGGKVEQEESLIQALDREFQEELGLRVNNAYPLLKCPFDYEDKSVLLDVWEITDHVGTPAGLEGQQICWQAVSALQAHEFPAANVPIIHCLKLPRVIAITPQLATRTEFLDYVRHLLSQHPDAIQIRQKQLQPGEYRDWFEKAALLAADSNIDLFCNAQLHTAMELGASAVHLDSTQLMNCNARPVSAETLLAVSCHDLDELRQAQKIQADLALLSPVATTPKYRPAQLLGWAEFSRLSSLVSLPVVALGGLRLEQLDEARSNGAFGVAGIQMFAPA